MAVEWFGDKVLNSAIIKLDNASKEIAGNVMDDAKKILKKKAKTTTERGLLDQFYIDKSKFKNGGYLVYCQGPKNWISPYHASFLEMGTFKDQAKPYMRPALKKNKRNASKKFKNAMDKL